MPWPHVLTVTRRHPRKDKWINYTGEFHLELLVRLKCLPIMVPVVAGTLEVLAQYRTPMHGLLLVEGEDIEPKYYRARPANHAYLEKTHPLKDRIEIALIKYAIRHDIPLMGICRGNQMLNVVCGGTLYGDVQKEKSLHRKHIDYDHYDTYRHPITILPDTPLKTWYGRRQMKVNSYHHQGIRELAPCFRPMATADDGLVEAYYDPRSRFRVGLQFHPERMLPEHVGNLRVWLAFAHAVHRYAGSPVRKAALTTSCLDSNWSTRSDLFRR